MDLKLTKRKGIRNRVGRFRSTAMAANVQTISNGNNWTYFVSVDTPLILPSVAPTLLGCFVPDADGLSQFIPANRDLSASS